VFARGVLVIGGDAIGFGALPPAITTYFQRYNSARPPVNACYALERTRPAQSFAGLPFVRWMRLTVEDAERDSVRFELYRSPDAGHVVRARWERGVLKGLGYSFVAAAMGSAASWGPDSVIATRIGGPDEGLCAAKALRQCQESGICSGV
jgi:hypothetical protein